MLLASMQQDEATRAEPVFVATVQKRRSFLLSIWAVLHTTKWHEINTLECVHIYFLCPCSVHLHEIGSSCLIVLNLEYFVTSRQRYFLFNFFLKMTDMAGTIPVAQRLTCYFWWKSINTILSVLFATEACYTIKENNNIEKSFDRSKLTILWT